MRPWDPDLFWPGFLVLANGHDHPRHPHLVSKVATYIYYADLQATQLSSGWPYRDLIIIISKIQPLPAASFDFAQHKDSFAAGAPELRLTTHRPVSTISTPILQPAWPHFPFALILLQLFTRASSLLSRPVLMSLQPLHHSKDHFLSDTAD